MKAVRFDEYGPVAVLDVRDVPIPEEVLVRSSSGSRPRASTRARPRSVTASCTSAGPPRSRPGRAATSPAWWSASTGRDRRRRAGRGHRLGRYQVKPGRVRGRRPRRPRAAAVRPALGGSGRDPGGRLHRLGDGPRGRRQAGRHRRRRRGGRRRRLARGPAGQARGRDRDRAGGPVQPRLAQASRRDPGRVRRRRRRPDQGERQDAGRRVSRHVRRRLRGAGPERPRVSPERIDSVTRPDAAAKYGIKIDGNGAGASAATLETLAGRSPPRNSSCPSRGRIR